MGEVSPERGDLTVSDYGWLSAEEKNFLAQMRFPKRRMEWLSGRWTAKRMLLKALPALAGIPMAEISIEHHKHGYPLVQVEGQPLLGCLSISHRGEKAAAAYAADDDIFIGIDVEWIEERHPAFLQDYFTVDEIEWVNSVCLEERAARTTLLWSAKEAALKALRLGLAADTRLIEVHPGMEKHGEDWLVLNYRSALPEEGYRLIGWWQQRGNTMLTLAVHFPDRETLSFCLREIYQNA
ncbi:MAG: 4'-phosphopantetheinyl transferase family protein [Bellilinea sp.]